MSRKIQDTGEVRRWIEEGRTYKWMAEEYARKYNIEISPTTFSEFRRREGIDGRNVRNDELIPWAVKPGHRWAYQVQMLRAEGRRRAGLDMNPASAGHLEVFLRSLAENDAVVHYEPETEQGFFYVPREPGTRTSSVARSVKILSGDPHRSPSIHASVTHSTTSGGARYWERGASWTLR